MGRPTPERESAEVRHGRLLTCPLRGCLFRHLAIVNVRGGAEPCRDPAEFVAAWHRACQKPAVLAVVPAVADLDLVIDAFRERVLPLIEAAVSIVGTSVSRS